MLSFPSTTHEMDLLVLSSERFFDTVVTFPAGGPLLVFGCLFEQGINAQPSPSPEGHAFPRLRLQYKPSLVQVQGGSQHLPVTDPAARVVTLSPFEW
ncbi:hypothetical protein R1sor_007626 [Riccia sorocarpa]|uniref:Uncharacterized protein n=1 Tax=Riccia sorocarpa TaxID=122646 RepID=A0ABD3HR12_9MARC